MDKYSDFEAKTKFTKKFIIWREEAHRRERERERDEAYSRRGERERERERELGIGKNKKKKEMRSLRYGETVGLI